MRHVELADRRNGLVLIQESFFPGEPVLDAAAERTRLVAERRARRNAYQRAYRRRRAAERALLALNGTIFD